MKKRARNRRTAASTDSPTLRVAKAGAGKKPERNVRKADWAWIERLYLLNFTLLFTHELDSAFWREWTLFKLPGGIQSFLLLHVPLVMAALLGYREVVRGLRHGLGWSLALAVAGAVAFLVHSYFLLTGHPEFRLPVSLALLALILVVSLAQAVVTLQAYGRRRQLQR